MKLAYLFITFVFITFLTGCMTITPQPQNNHIVKSKVQTQQKREEIVDMFDKELNLGIHKTLQKKEKTIAELGYEFFEKEGK